MNMNDYRYTHYPQAPQSLKFLSSWKVSSKLLLPVPPTTYLAQATTDLPSVTLDLHILEAQINGIVSFATSIFKYMHSIFHNMHFP